MANMTIRSTYAFDVETVHQLDDLAEHWSTSKSAALRRAIREAASRAKRPHMEAIADLDRLHAQLVEKQVDIDQWVRDIQEERKASADRRADRLTA